MNTCLVCCILIAFILFGIAVGTVIEYNLFRKIRCKACSLNNDRIAIKKAKTMLKLKDVIDKDFLLFVRDEYIIVGHVNLSSLYHTWKYIKNMKCTSCDKNYSNIVGDLYQDSNGNTLNSTIKTFFNYLNK